MAAALAQLGRLDEARVALPAPAAAQGYASIGEIQADSYRESDELERLVEGMSRCPFPRRGVSHTAVSMIWVSI